MERYTFQKDLTLKKQYDVIVAGGGVAGVAAAVSAAKRGASVLLLEKSNILGGLATLGLVNLFVPMCNGRGKQIIFGLCERWVRMSATLGYSTIPKEWQLGEPEEPTKVRYSQRYSPYIFAMQLLEELREAGADILFDCVATEPVMDGKVCRGVITNSKSGLELYGCKMLIDTTGDCDILRAAGVPVVKGQNFFTYYARMLTLDGCKRALERGKISEAVKSVYGGNINLWGDGQPEDVPRWSGTTVDEVTDYLVTNQLLMLKNIRQHGGKGVDVTHFPLMPQFRTTCRIDGDYTFSVGDAYRHFNDSVGAINDFEHRDHLFEVPYRSLVRHDYPNIITAGRSASGKGYGWDLLRVIPPAIITGQAAGEAAALALKSNTGVAFVDIKKLQSNLEAGNVMIHFPDEYIPEDRTIILHGKNAAEIEGGHI